MGHVTLAVDPGKDTGLAFFRGARLVGVQLVDGADPPRIGGIDAIVCEIPHAGDGRATKSDIITLSVRAGLAIGAARAPGVTLRLVTPSDWKGQTPKDVSHARTLGLLDAQERAVLDAALGKIPRGRRHNILDAVGIGIWALGR